MSSPHDTASRQNATSSAHPLARTDAPAPPAAASTTCVPRVIHADPESATRRIHPVHAAATSPHASAQPSAVSRFVTLRERLHRVDRGGTEQHDEQYGRMHTEGVCADRLGILLPANRFGLAVLAPFGLVADCARGSGASLPARGKETFLLAGQVGTGSTGSPAPRLHRDAGRVPWRPRR